MQENFVGEAVELSGITYQWLGIRRSMLAWEYEIIPSSEGILIGQLSNVFHELH